MDFLIHFLLYDLRIMIHNNNMYILINIVYQLVVILIYNILFYQVYLHIIFLNHNNLMDMLIYINLVNLVLVR